MPKCRRELRRLMSNLLMEKELFSENSQYKRNCEQGYQDDESVSIKVRMISSANILGTCKSIETNSRKSYSYSRVTTRRFTSAHVASVGNLQSSDLAGMNISTVISARSLSRPSVNFLAANSDIHGEFRTDLLNLIPTNRDFTKRISDSDSFIEDSHLRANKGEVKEIANQQRPTKSGDEAIGGFQVKTLRSQASSQKVNGSSEEVTTSCAINFQISHTNSLSRKVVR